MDVPELGSLFDTNQTNVSCFGGGPGSDLLGILKFIKMQNRETSLRCCVYDRQEMWRESLRGVCNNLTAFRIIPTFRSLDITYPKTWRKYPEILDSNLFTVSFLMSEVY